MHCPLTHSYSGGQGGQVGIGGSNGRWATTVNNPLKIKGICAKLKNFLIVSQKSSKLPSEFFYSNHKFSWR